MSAPTAELAPLPPLRVLFLVGRDPEHPAVGGGDLQAWAWARWCVQQGHQVVLVSQSHRSLPSAGEREGIHVLRLGGGILLAFRAYLYYRKHAAEFDLVYEDPIGAGRSPFLSPIYSRVPVVAVWHQVSAPLLRVLHNPVAAFALSSVERLVARFYRKSLLWVPSDERAREVSRELHLDESNIVVIPPTISRRVVTAVSADERPPTVLFLGVIRPYKSIEHVIRAFPAVAHRLPSARLVVAGRRMDRKYEARLVALVAELGIDDRVDFILDVPELRKHVLLAEARLLVLPSLLEGFGIVALEASAVGTPVVASSGVPTAAVTHELNGLRYDYGDIDQLRDSLLRLLIDDDLYARCSTQGLASAARFTPERVGVDFNLLLARALGRDPSPASAKGTRHAT